MRIRWIDRLKGILILLVVSGHLIGGCYHLMSEVSQPMAEYLYKVIYYFHMPAFFFVAGLTWSSKDIAFLTYSGRKAQRLLIPYFFFGFVSALLYVMLSCSLQSIFATTTTGAYVNKGHESWWMPFISIIHAGGWPDGHGFQCNSVLWFLPVMFSLQIVYFWIDRFLKKWMLIFLVVVLVFIGFYARPFWRGLPWGIDLVITYLPFFIFGKLVSGALKRCAESIVVMRGTNITLLGMFLTIYLLVCYYTPNMALRNSSLMWDVISYFMATFGIVLSLWFALLCRCEWLERLGLASLVIMLTHKFFVIAILNKARFVSFLVRDYSWLALPISILLTGSIAFACYGIYQLLRRFVPLLIGEKR